MRASAAIFCQRQEISLMMRVALWRQILFKLQARKSRR
jgi:hypothetical protein